MKHLTDISLPFQAFNVNSWSWTGQKFIQSFFFSIRQQRHTSAVRERESDFDEAAVALNPLFHSYHRLIWAKNSRNLNVKGAILRNAEEENQTKEGEKLL